MLNYFDYYFNLIVNGLDNGCFFAGIIVDIAISITSIVIGVIGMIPIALFYHYCCYYHCYCFSFSFVFVLVFSSC